jgi:L-2-hydroxyglutarate oxidase LhgO
MEQVDCLVIGAGVIGLAVARELALSGREVILLEAADAIGTGTSSRNSEVIHAGIYYPAGSLKARTCVEGKHMLYEFCDAHGVPYKRLGKLIVASSEDQLPTLQSLKAKAEANGVMDLSFLSRAEALALEPNLDVVGALLSPSSGVIDSHSFMLALQGDAEAAGAMIAFETPVVGGLATSNRIEIEAGGANPMALSARLVVNCAGLHCVDVAHLIQGIPEATKPKLYYAKGNYFGLTGKPPFSRLIYPVPEAAGLGVHITIDMGMRARFGPDVEWIDKLDYEVDPARADPFYAAVRRYWPGLKDGQLYPDYAGIRPKLQTPTGEAADFVIQGPSVHGVPGLINLYGIESPGLTASLALARLVGAAANDSRTVAA